MSLLWVIFIFAHSFSKIIRLMGRASSVPLAPYIKHGNVLSRAKGAGSPVNRQSAGQRRDTVQKSLSPFGRVTD